MAILKNISYLFTAQTVNLCLGFISSIFITRLLGAEGRGTYALFTNAVGFSTLFFGFSINATIVYFINSGKIALERLLSSLIVFCFVSTFLVLCALLCLKYAGFLHFALPDDFQTWKYITLFCVLHFNTVWTSIFAVILNAFKVFKAQSLISIIPTSLSLLIYVIAYYSGSSNEGQNNFNLILLVTLGAACLSCAATTAIYIKKVSVYPSKYLINWSEFNLIITFSLLAYLGNVLQFFSYRLDFWFVDGFLGKVSLGIYSLATQLAQLIWILPNAVAGILYSYAAAESKENAMRYAASLSVLTFAVGLFISVAEITVLYFKLTSIYGDDFALTFPVTITLMFGTIILSPAIVLAAYFASQGKYKINLYGTTVGTASCFVFYPLLIKNYGVFGAAVASNLAYFFNFCVLFYFAKKDGIHFLKTAVASFSDKFKIYVRRFS